MLLNHPRISISSLKARRGSLEFRSEGTGSYLRIMMYCLSVLYCSCQAIAGVSVLQYTNTVQYGTVASRQGIGPDRIPIRDCN